MCYHKDMKMPDRRKLKRGAYTAAQWTWGLPQTMIGVPRSRSGKVDDFLLNHEYGHTLQSLILGPFYLIFVGAPSILWNRLPHFRRKRKRTGKSYYSAPFESSANRLAARAGRRHHH